VGAKWRMWGGVAVGTGMGAKWECCGGWEIKTRGCLPSLQGTGWGKGRHTASSRGACGHSLAGVWSIAWHGSHMPDSCSGGHGSLCMVSPGLLSHVATVPCLACPLLLCPAFPGR
jgi:hypothetical protein